ncbi:MAG: RHS repeat protein [Nannocystis sp.]|nr:RHS repeat protein [Nannocystis sp.]
MRDWERAPLREVGPDGLRTTRVWDERGCLLREILGEGLPEALTARTVYDIVGRVQQEFHADGAARSFERDPWGRVTLAVLEGGARVRTTWGPMDRVLGEDIEGDPGDGGPERLLARMSLAYDERGRLLRSTVHAFVADPDDGAALTSTRWHDADGLCVRRVEPTGEAWSLEYDGLMRLRVTEDPLGNRSRVDFGVNGLPELVTEDDQGPDGQRTRSTKLMHDARGRLTSTLRPSGAVRSFRWDARDLMVEQTDPLGVITRHGFGLLGEAMRQHLDPGGLDLVYSQEFDLAGRPRTATDPTGRVTKLQHDVLGRVRTLTLPDGGQVILELRREGSPGEAHASRWRRTHPHLRRRRSPGDPRGQARPRLHTCPKAQLQVRRARPPRAGERGRRGRDAPLRQPRPPATRRARRPRLRSGHRRPAADIDTPLPGWPRGAAPARRPRPHDEHHPAKARHLRGRPGQRRPGHRPVRADIPRPRSGARAPA